MLQFLSDFLINRICIKKHEYHASEVILSWINDRSKKLSSCLLQKDVPLYFRNESAQGL